MTNNQQPKNINYKDSRMIDFLEDPNFRNWILYPEEMADETIRRWEKVVEQNKHARHARYVMQSLKAYFDRSELSEADVQARLEAEIQKYRRRQKVEQRKRITVIWTWSAAATVLLLVGLVFLLQWFNRPIESYKTGFGERMSITLPDESTIELNSNSELTWNRDWETSGERIVKLNGEAFFKVKNRNNMPFRVNTDDVTIHVIGTEFNVNSRRQQTQVYLEKGKVNVAIVKHPEETVEMEPGEELVYQAQTDKVEKKSIKGAEEISSWKEGLLIFRDEPLVKVLKSVSDIYGKEFVTKDSALLHRNITTTIPLTNWEISLTAIQLAMKLDIQEENDTIRIKQR